MNTIAEIMASNPSMTYGQAVGFSIGLGAIALGDKFAGLSPDEWLNATDDYAHGYRQAWGRRS